MRIRPIDADDLPAVGALLRQLGYDRAGRELAESIARVRGAHDHHAVVAERDGRILGLLHVFERPALEKPSEAVVQALVVDETCRRQGVGEALMREAEAWAGSRMLGSICLHTRADREEAHAFYAGIGYATAAISHLMRKKLSR